MRAAARLASLVSELWSRSPLGRSGGFGVHRPLRVTAAAASDVGRVRGHNEDYVLIVDLATSVPAGDGASPGGAGDIAGAGGGLAEVPLLIVADGMGGAAAGGVASEMAATLIATHLGRAWQEGRMQRPIELRGCLLEAFASANGAVYGYASGSLGLEGMGTTATAATVVGGDLWIGHVGDSRAYLLRDGRAQRLTKDHSLVQHLIDTGAPSDAAARVQSRNALVRAIGPCAEVTVDIYRGGVRPGDALLLCCDGLWSAVADDEIVEIVAGAAGPRLACEALIDRANARGGDDNISVLVARIDDGSDPGE